MRPDVHCLNQHHRGQFYSRTRDPQSLEKRGIRRQLPPSYQDRFFVLKLFFPIRQSLPQMSSTSMTPPTQSPVTDGQPNIEFGWLSDSDLSTPLDWGFQTPSNPDVSNFSTFSDIDSFFGPDLSFEGLGPEIQSARGTQEYQPEESFLVGSSSPIGGDVVSTTTLGSTTAKPSAISTSENLEHHTSVDIESSTATVQTVEV